MYAYSEHSVRALVALVMPTCTQAAAAPAQALRAALGKSKRAGVVMDASSLGSVSGLGDQEIAQKSRGLPVDRIAIVRVFAEDGPTAVVTFYDSEAKPVAAMSVRRGEKLAERPRSVSGVSARAAAVVGEVVGGTAGQRSTAEEEFEQRAVWLQGITSVSANQYGAWTTSWEEPRLGKYGKSLTWPEFFTLVGRNDLSQQIQTADAS